MLRIYVCSYTGNNFICTDENQRLKEQIESMTESAVVLEHKHKEQMEEAMENMETLRKAHRRETAQMQENIQQESKLIFFSDKQIVLVYWGF